MSKNPPQGKEEYTCRKCKTIFVPSFEFNFYQDGDDPTVGLCESCMMAEAFSAKSRNDPKPLPTEPPNFDQVVCRINQGKRTCSFLGVSGQGFRCLKGSSLEATIKERLLSGSMDARGDNCSGPPNFTPTTTPK